MLSVRMENIGDMAIVECEGSILRDDSAYRLRDAITSHSDARIIVMDLSELKMIRQPGLSMLVFLQRWAHDHKIQLKLFNPSNFVRYGLERASSIYEFEIPTLQEMMILLAEAENHQQIAA